MKTNQNVGQNVETSLRICRTPAGDQSAVNVNGRGSSGATAGCGGGAGGSAGTA